MPVTAIANATAKLKTFPLFFISSFVVLITIFTYCILYGHCKIRKSGRKVNGFIFYDNAGTRSWNWIIREHHSVKEFNCRAISICSRNSYMNVD